MINAYGHNNINFAGHSGASRFIPPGGDLKQCIHRSYFMRDFAILDFSTKYLKQKFTKGGHIADFACSQGQETYSLAMLLDDVNHDKKFSVTGVDLSPIIIRAAESGVFAVEPRANESVLIPSRKAVESMKSYYFVDSLGKQINYNSHSEDIDIPKTQRQRVRALFSSYFERDKKANPEIVKFLINTDFVADSRIFVAKDSKTKGIVDFAQGNIMDISNILKNKKSAAIFFQNALYHITEAGVSGSTSAQFVDKAATLFGEIHKNLVDDGIFVMGRLPRDHLLGFEEKRTREIVQNGKKIKVFDSSPIHDALRNSGFEPVLYEVDSAFGQTYLPAVWKKTTLV